MNEHIQQFLDNWFNGMMPTVEQYKTRVYELWQDPNTRNNIFGNIPINENGEGGFTTACPPIPWMGSLNAPYILICLEPMLSAQTFINQVQYAGEGEQSWEEAYFENYFNYYFGDLEARLIYFWKQLALLFLQQQYLAQIDNRDHLVGVLSANIIDFPLVQYHAIRHPTYMPQPPIFADLAIRLSFLNGVNQNRILVYGKSAFDKIGDYFWNSFHIQETVYCHYAGMAMPVYKALLDVNGNSYNVICVKQKHSGYNPTNEAHVVLGDFIREQFNNFGFH
jgi:hypothetical protein